MCHGGGDLTERDGCVEPMTASPHTGSAEPSGMVRSHDADEVNVGLSTARELLIKAPLPPFVFL